MLTSSKVVTNGAQIHSAEIHVHKLQTARSRAPTFITQANASLRKNLVFQMRNYQSNVCIITFPIFICLILLGLQEGVNKLLDTPQFKCGCQEQIVNGSVVERCGLLYTNGIRRARFCQNEHPAASPALMQVPNQTTNASQQLRNSSRVPAILYTGVYPQTASAMADQLLHNDVGEKDEDSLIYYSRIVAGSSAPLAETLLFEKAFIKDDVYVLQTEQCTTRETYKHFMFNLGDIQIPSGATPRCLQTFLLNSSSVQDINSEIYHAAQARIEARDTRNNDIVTAYDFHDTSVDNLVFNVSVYYNAFKKSAFEEPEYYRVSRPMNLAAQAFLRLLLGPNSSLPLWFVKEVPREASQLRLDFSLLLGPLFYMWVSALLFPVMVTTLVYEKQGNLRMMMKMHGLGDGAYWVITYGYFLTLSLFYFAAFVAVGSAVDLNFFRLNAYSIQFVFFFIYMNLQIALSFTAATLFQNYRTATVCGYIYVFGCGLLGQYFFSFILEDKEAPRSWSFSLELLPASSLYRGLYELQQYATVGSILGSRGMRWENLNDERNGLRTVFLIQSVEWFVFMVTAVYLDQVLLSSGSGMRKHPLFFLGFTRAPGGVQVSRARKEEQTLSSSASEIYQGIDMEKLEVLEERARVEQLRNKPWASSHAVICENLKAVYPGEDGNPDKYAVRGVSLVVERGECFGMLGPNGAGKSTMINMMTGLMYPTSGSAYIYGLDIRKDMGKIYTSMGFCPQHDLLWEQLTGREHLLFYGRLKSLRGRALWEAVNASLTSVNLLERGDKRVKEYSGGMKRRLSVAMSLIGDPQVVYMDEPSTGLDPGSRSSLWKVVKEAKKNRAIILTTHSMEEAEALCDRLCIFVNGRIQCIGDSKELTNRYGGVYVLTVTTPEEEEENVVNLMKILSCNAQKIYGHGGMQKFEIPKKEVEIGRIFATMLNVKEKLRLEAWGVSDATLEDVFLKVACCALREDKEWT